MLGCNQVGILSSDTNARTALSVPEAQHFSLALFAMQIGGA